MINELISIIMPTYNRLNTIGDAIDSVIEQSYKNWELIIIDDASTDNTAQLVKSYADNRIRYYKNNKNIGANSSRNRGISYAKGKYITFLDSDCKYKKNKLEEQIDTISYGYDMVFCSFEYYKDGKCVIKPIPMEEKDYYDKNLKKILPRNNIIDTSTIFAKRDVFTKVGTFDESMPRLQDYELAIRIVKNTKVKYMESALVENYFTENSISTNHEAYFIAIVQLLKMHRDFFDDDKNIFEFVCSGLTYCMDRNLGISVVNHYLDILQKELLEEFADVVYKVNRYTLEIYQLKSLLYEGNSEMCIMNLHKRMKEEFIVYGAGQKAKELYSKLTEEEKENLKYFVVSNKKPEMDTFYGKKVFSLQDVINNKEKEEISIILALNVRNAIMVRRLLDTTKYKNYVFCDIK